MRQSKYETHIKPFLEKIKELKQSGATDKEIYKSLGVSKNVWLKAKKDQKDLKGLLANIEYRKNSIEKLQEAYDSVLPYECWIEKLQDKAFKEDTAISEFIKAMKQIFPECNHWLKLEYAKLEQIERLKRSEIELDDQTIVITTDVIKRE